ncbi:MAG: hypothetical protein SPD85_02850, partial [Candidatus Cryptobacteroides sp.]|nr:hypothetical protein [Candidatus Cryptobacteroides sp.]
SEGPSEGRKGMPNAPGRVRRWSKRAGTAGPSGKGTYYVVKGLTKGSKINGRVEILLVKKQISDCKSVAYLQYAIGSQLAHRTYATRNP